MKNKNLHSRLSVLMAIIYLVVGCSGPNEQKKYYSKPSENKDLVVEEKLTPQKDNNVENKKTSSLSPEKKRSMYKQIVQLVESVTEYVPPKTESEVTLLAEKVRADVLPLLAMKKNESTGTCKTYFANLVEILAQFQLHSQALITEKDENTKFYRMARLRVLLGQMSIFLNLAKTNRASGVNALMEIEKTAVNSCPLISNPNWIAQLDKAQKKSVDYINALFGVDPISASEFMMKLEDKNIEDHKAEARKKIYFMIGATIVSIALWHVMLAQAAVVATAIGTTKLMVVLPTTMIMGAADSVAYIYVERNFVAHDGTWIESYIGQERTYVSSQADWEHLMDQTEEFLDLKLESPIIYAQFIWSEHKSRLDRYTHILYQLKPVLDTLERKYGSMDAAIKALKSEQEIIYETH
jgi:hypothetical protein